MLYRRRALLGSLATFTETLSLGVAVEHTCTLYRNICKYCKLEMCAFNCQLPTTFVTDVCTMVEG